jgi:1-acyl-sn-glycerol-3-phosphate acyltransferase
MSLALLRTLLWTDPLVVFFTAFFGSLNLFFVPFDKGGDKQVWLAKKWASVLVKVMGIKITVEGLENLDPGQHYIFAGNHRSYTDTPVLLSTLPGNFRFMAKSELFDIPLMGHHLKTAGHIPVSLTNPREAVRSLTQAGQKIRDQKLSIIIFPEGGRTMGELEPFKEGAAILAIKSGTPIVPFGLIGTTEVMQMHSIAIHPGPVRIILGKPIPTEGLDTKQKTVLTERLRNEVAGLLGVEP